MVTGRYVTVWRKNAAGQWKGLIDIGNPDSK
jgi:ketosteroid isomerase-like protein